jgi:hypothetical protein
MSIKLKIVSDGTPRGTKIFDEETGSELRNVVDLKWELSARDLSSCNVTMRLARVPLELLSEIEVKLLKDHEQ